MDPFTQAAAPLTWILPPCGVSRMMPCLLHPGGTCQQLPSVAVIKTNEPLRCRRTRTIRLDERDKKDQMGEEASSLLPPSRSFQRSLRRHEDILEVAFSLKESLFPRKDNARLYTLLFRFFQVIFVRYFFQSTLMPFLFVFKNIINGVWFSLCLLSGPFFTTSVFRNLQTLSQHSWWFHSLSLHCS